MLEDWRCDLKEEYGIVVNEQQILNVINVMTNEFPSESRKNTYANCIFVEKKDIYSAESRLRTYDEKTEKERIRMTRFQKNFII